jgi:hypothetical protein
MQDDVKSTWIPTWHQMDHVSWSLGLLKNHLLEEGPMIGEHWQLVIDEPVEFEK